MNPSAFSCGMAVLWFDVFALVCLFLWKKNKFILQYSMLPITLLLLCGVLRIIMPLDLPFAVILHSETLLPSVMNRLCSRLFVVLGREISLGSFLLMIWAFGGFLLLAVAFVMAVKDARAISRFPTASAPRVEAIVAKVMADERPRQKYRLIVTEEASSAMMCGFFRPTFVLPDFIETFSEDEIIYVVRHELYHFLGGDAWTKLTLILLQCLMWWNPLVYMLRGSLDQLFDLRCDISVSRDLSNRQRADYLTAMLKFVRRLVSEEQTAPSELLLLPSRLVSVESADKLFQRFQLVRDYNKAAVSRIRTFVASVLLCAVFFASFFVLVQPSSQPEGMENSASSSAFLSDNMYLVNIGGGKYDLYVDGECCATYTKDDLQHPPLSRIRIIEGELQ